MASHDRNDLLERSLELERFRLKLWDKYLSIRSKRNLKVPFEFVNNFVRCPYVSNSHLL